MTIESLSELKIVVLLTSPCSNRVLISYFKAVILTLKCEIQTRLELEDVSKTIILSSDNNSLSEITTEFSKILQY